MDNLENKIIKGDCLQQLPLIPDNSVNLVITSPPYFQQRDYQGGENEIGSEEHFENYLDALLQVFTECKRILKEDGLIVFNIGDKYINSSLTLLPHRFAIIVLDNNKDVFLVNQLTWHKLNPTPRQDRSKLIQSTEPFFIFAKSKNYKFKLEDYLQHLDYMNKENKKTNGTSKLGSKYFELIEKSGLSLEEKKKAASELSNIIKEVADGKLNSFRMKIKDIHKLPYGGQNGGRLTQILKNGFTIIKIYGNKLKKDIIESPVENTIDNDHPAVYPLYIIQELIKLLTDKGDVVLDPFAGSGTTCIAAQNLNRKYIGIEINERYIKIAEERLRKQNFYQEELYI